MEPVNLDESHERLAAARKEFEDRKRLYISEKKIILAKELELMNSVLQYDEYIQATLRKKVQAESRIEDERKTQNEQDKVIEKLKVELQDLSIQQEAPKEKLKMYEPVSNYLQSVLKECHKFEEVKDIISHHAALDFTAKQLILRRESSLAKFDENKRELLKKIQEKEMEITSAGERIRKLECQIDSEKAEFHRLLQEKKEVETQEAADLIQSHQIKLIIFNMFQIIQHYDRRPPKHANVKEQLATIGEFMLDLEFVVEEISRSERPASDAAEASHVTLSRVLRAERR